MYSDVYFLWMLSAIGKLVFLIVTDHRGWLLNIFISVEHMQNGGHHLIRGKCEITRSLVILMAA